MIDDRYLIWSNEHRAWCAGGRSGYVDKIINAGRYSRDEAMQIVREAQFGRHLMRDGAPPEILVRECDAIETIQF